jgi:hypothetical protein
MVDHWTWPSHSSSSNGGSHDVSAMDVDGSHHHLLHHHHNHINQHQQAPAVVPFHLRPPPSDLESVSALPRAEDTFSRLLIPSGSSRSHRGSLYIGNLAVAAEMNWLTSNGVCYVVNCTEDISDHFPHDTELTYKRVPLSSSLDSSPFGHFEGAAKEIFEKLSLGQTVLIFCVDGLRRALCIAFAYMMQYEGLTLMKCVEYMRQLKCNVFFTEGQQRALFELETTLRRPKEVRFLKQMSRPKPKPKKKEVRTMVKVKVRALPKKKLVRGTRPLSSIKAEDIRRSLSLAPLSPLLRRNMDATRQYSRPTEDDSKWVSCSEQPEPVTQGGAS